MSMGTGDIRIETSIRFITQVKAERYDFDLVFGRTKEVATSTSPTPRAGQTFVDRPPETTGSDRSPENMQAVCDAMFDLRCEGKELDDWGLESNTGWD
jgi:hypothetical protein